MCNEVIVDGTVCSTHGELMEAIGGEPAYKYDDMGKPEPDDCLCSLDVEKTAVKFGLVIDREQSSHWETVMSRPTVDVPAAR
jgi:hypothetical protein